MLQIEHVNKVYRTGGLVQRALNDVTLSLRDNEFVAILGPSGSGKTTFLNIVGGLDRYDSGNLTINGVSTQQYTDRDWDAYRNHAVGFVFQSYNLIPHQTILSNVELALTIAGLDRRERKRRAMEALEKVGLADQAKKIPSQLSGGQMQRVAIARALINDPEILLADEPTGALDTDTSLQVMELLKEVAKERLVVLVTHNSDLANEYANRIIRLQDGAVVSDSNPYEPTLAEVAALGERQKLGRAHMSLWTSVTLSLNNLFTKKTRTILTAVAGSIGIIGIALILAISSGVNSYIDALETDMVQQYPLEIADSYYNVSAYVSARSDAGGMLSGLFGGNDSETYDERTVDISALIYNIFSGQTSNDLVSLQTYLEENSAEINQYVSSIEYSYGITPQIYQDNSEEVIQVHPDHFFDVLGFGSTVSSNDIMTSLVDTDAFFQMPEEDALYKDSYDVLAGRWPESYNELVLVMNEGPSTTDIALYMMGLRDMSEMEGMIEQFVNGEEVEQPAIDEVYTIDDFLGISFKLVKNTDLYEYDSQYGVWTDKSDDEAYMQQLVNDGEKLTIVGVVVLKEGVDSGVLNAGFDYMPSLIDYLAEDAAKSEIVQQQMANPDINVFTGEPFGQENAAEEFDLSSVFYIDEDIVSDSFTLDDETMDDLLGESVTDLVDSLDLDEATDSLDLSGLVDLSSIRLEIPEFDLSLGELMSTIIITASVEDLTGLFTELLEDYMNSVAGDPEMDLTGIGTAFTEYLRTEDAQEILVENLAMMIRQSGGMQVSTDNIRSLYTEFRTDVYAWMLENGYSDMMQLDDYIDEYLGTERAQSLMDGWTQENLQFDLSGVTISAEQTDQLSADLIAGYEAYAASGNGMPDPAAFGSGFSDYLQSDTAQRIIAQSLTGMARAADLEAQIDEAVTSYTESAVISITESMSSQLDDEISAAVDQITVQLQEQIESMLTESMEGIGDSLLESFSVDPESLLDAVVMDMDAMELLELLSSMSGSSTSTYEGNLEILGYTDFSSPDGIKIYPKDFEGKNRMIEILDSYNEQMVEAGEPQKAVTYTDSIGSMMSLITEIVNILSYVLIAFVAISLVVSSIMIGVITYISVLERKKEIGILRAIGASKRNISQVFNAETVIIGLAAGILGVVVTLLLTLPINSLLHNLLGISDLSARLPFLYAIILIILSVVLTLLAGMIPSRKASRSDPVEALRSE